MRYVASKTKMQIKQTLCNMLQTLLLLEGLNRFTGLQHALRFFLCNPCKIACSCGWELQVGLSRCAGRCQGLFRAKYTWRRGERGKRRSREQVSGVKLSTQACSDPGAANQPENRRGWDSCSSSRIRARSCYCDEWSYV